MKTAVYNVIFADAAEYDLNGIYEYISKRLGALMTAARTVIGIKKAADKLAYWPYRFPMVLDEFGKQIGKYRYRLVKKYLLVYTVDENNNTVNVTRIFHSLQNWRKYIAEDRS